MAISPVRRRERTIARFSARGEGGGVLAENPSALPRTAGSEPCSGPVTRPEKIICHPDVTGTGRGTGDTARTRTAFPARPDTCTALPRTLGAAGGRPGGPTVPQPGVLIAMARLPAAARARHCRYDDDGA